MTKQKLSTPAEGFKIAIDAYAKKVGPTLGRRNGVQAHLARELGVSRQNVGYWISHGVSIDFLGKVSKLTGVSRRILRPDLYD